MQMQTFKPMTAQKLTNENIKKIASVIEYNVLSKDYLKRAVTKNMHNLYIKFIILMKMIFQTELLNTMMLINYLKMNYFDLRHLTRLFLMYKSGISLIRNSVSYYIIDLHLNILYCLNLKSLN